MKHAVVVFAFLALACAASAQSDQGGQDYIYLEPFLDGADWTLTGAAQIENGVCVVDGVGTGTATIGAEDWVSTGFRFLVYLEGDGSEISVYAEGENLATVALSGGLVHSTLRFPVTGEELACDTMPYNPYCPYLVTVSARSFQTWRELWVYPFECGDPSNSSCGIFTTPNPPPPVVGPYTLAINSSSRVAFRGITVYGAGTIPAVQSSWSAVKSQYR
ncbi:MAG: hypothetical protein R6X35_03065 [Candidatus Krumholzibacteriia bacterium]